MSIISVCNQSLTNYTFSTLPYKASPPNYLNPDTHRIPTPQIRTTAPNRRIPQHQLLQRHAIHLLKCRTILPYLDYIPLHTRRRNADLRWARRRRGHELVADDRSTQLSAGRSLVVVRFKRWSGGGYVKAVAQGTRINANDDDWIPRLQV